MLLWGLWCRCCSDRRGKWVKFCKHELVNLDRFVRIPKNLNTIQFLCKFTASAGVGANPKTELDSSLVPISWTKWDGIDNRNLTWRGKGYLLPLICTCYIRAEQIHRTAFHLYSPCSPIPKWWRNFSNIWHKLMQINYCSAFWFCFSLGASFVAKH